MSYCFAITGWYGRGNIGDELLLRAVCQRLREQFPGAKVVALSLDPPVTAQASGCEAVLQVLPYRPWSDPRAWLSLTAQTLRGRGRWVSLVRKVAALVVGGGSLLHDRHTGNLDLWLRLVKLYRWMGVKVYFYGIGLGPFRDPARSMPVVREILGLSSGCSFRDPISADLAESLLPETHFIRASDPVIGLLPIQSRPACTWPRSGPLRVGFNCSPMGSLSQQETVAFGAELAAGVLRALPSSICFVPMSRTDLPVAAGIADRLPAALANSFAIAPHEMECLDRHIEIYNNLDLVVTSRLHTAIIAATANLPIVALDLDPKLPGFLREAGYGELIVSGPADQQDCERAIREVVSRAVELRDRWPAFQSRCWEAMQRLAAREVRNCEGLKHILGSAER